MKPLWSLLLLAVVVLSTAACPIHHWSARQELEEEGFEEIYFGEMPGEPQEHPFYARRRGQLCSGIVDLSESEPRIESHCRPLGSSSGH